MEQTLEQTVSSMIENESPHARTLRGWLLVIATYVADHHNKLSDIAPESDPEVKPEGDDLPKIVLLRDGDTYELVVSTPEIERTGYGSTILEAFSNLVKVWLHPGGEPDEEKGKDGGDPLPPKFQVIEFTTGTWVYYHRSEGELLKGNGDTLDDALMDLAGELDKKRSDEEDELASLTEPVTATSLSAEEHKLISDYLDDKSTSTEPVSTETDEEKGLPF